MKNNGMQKRIIQIIVLMMILILTLPSAGAGPVLAEDADTKTVQQEVPAPADDVTSAQNTDAEGSNTEDSAADRTSENAGSAETADTEDTGNTAKTEDAPAAVSDTENTDGISADDNTEPDNVTDSPAQAEKPEADASENAAPSEAPAAANDQMQEEPLSETEAGPFDASKSDYLSYDPLYIAEYGDPAYIDTSNIDMISFYDIVCAARGVATYNIRKQSDFKLTENNYIAGLTYQMPVYDVDKNSKYYVALPDVNKLNKEFRSYDLILAYNNDYGEKISGYHYSKGILYIPKTAVDAPQNNHSVPDAAPVAVQLNYAVGTDMDLSKTIPVQVLNGSEPDELKVRVSNLFVSDAVEVSTGVKGRKDKDVSVYLNGSLIPANRDAWEYNSSDGKVSVSTSPGVISNINVVFKQRNVRETVSDTFTSFIDRITPDSYAAGKVSMDEMKYFKTESGKEVTLDIPPDKLFVGWRGTYTGKRVHGDTTKSETHSKLLACKGWEDSIQYMYGGFDSEDYVDGSDQYLAKHLAATWAYSSYASAYNVDPDGSGSSIDSSTEKIKYWNNKTKQEESKTIYEWLLLYRDDLELSKNNTGVSDSGKMLNNGLGGVNNFAFTMPKKVTGASTSLVSSGEDAGRANTSFTIKSAELDAASGSGDTSDYYDYWICASCNHLDKAEGDEGDSNKTIYVTCLGIGSDYAVLAFVQAGASGNQNACGVYKFRLAPTGYVKVKKVSSVPEVLTAAPGSYSLSGAVYRLYKDQACTVPAKDAKGNDAVLTTAANGESGVTEMDAGTYYVKETTASAGFELDSNVNGGKPVVITSDNTQASPYVINSTEKPKYAYVKLSKKAAQSETDFIKAAPNNYTIEGAEYRLYKDQACSAPAKDSSGKDVVLTTDRNGNTGTVAMIPGTYYAKEVKASRGFLTDSKVNAGKSITLSLSHSPQTPYIISSTEEPSYGMLSAVLYKQNDEYGYSRLLGAEYTLSYYDIDTGYGTSAASQDLTGKTPAASWVFRTREGRDSDGKKAAMIDFASDEPVSGDSLYLHKGYRVLPDGVFTLKETKPPVGIGADPEMYTGFVKQPSNGVAAEVLFNGSELLDAVQIDASFRLINTEPPKSVMIKLQKVDETSGKPQAEGADREYSKGSLAGAVYEVYMEDTDYPEDVKVGEIITDENGYGELYTDSHRDGKPLKAGKYYIKELSASPGYVVDSLTTKEKRGSYEDGRHVLLARLDESGDKLVYEFEVKSADAHHVTKIHKTDITGTSELPGAKLQVINSENQIVEEWISGDSPHDILALPDGKYTLREITAPYGYDIAEDAVFEVKSDVIVNEVVMKNRPVTISTTARDADMGSHSGSFRSDQKIIDRVALTGLYPGRTYKVSGVLMNKGTGKPLYDEVIETDNTEKETTGEQNTDEITSLTGRAEKEFIADAENMTVELEFTADSSAFEADTTLVVYEKLYRTSSFRDEEVPVELQKHEDPDDEEQSIHYGGNPEIRTVAVNPGSGEHIVFAGDKAELKDTVTYTNLIPGRKYTLRGTLNYKAGMLGTLHTVSSEGEPVTAETEFIPEDKSGTETVSFTFDASYLAGRKIVIFEQLYDGDKMVAEHSDIESEEQSAYIPEIKTSIGKKKGGKVTDKVKYTNLVPGRTYKVKGYFVRKSDGKRIEGSDGETVFTLEEKDGTVEVLLNPKKCGEKLVAFESVYMLQTEGDEEPGPDTPEILVGEHKDINDRAQTYSPVISPKTGDDNPLKVYMVTTVLAGATLLFIYMSRRAGSRRQRT